MQPAAEQVERIFRGNFACKGRIRYDGSFISFLIFIIAVRKFTARFYFIARPAGFAKLRSPEMRGVPVFIEKVPMKRLASRRGR